MFICNDCGCEFEKPDFLTEKHGLDSPPYEKICVCPKCQNTNYKKIAQYCKCCGAKLSLSQKDFCSEACRTKSQKLRMSEQKRLKLIQDSFVYHTVREVEEYNRKHKTRLSYGQFVALSKTWKKGTNTVIIPGKIYHTYLKQIKECEETRILIEEKISVVEDELLREILTLKYLCGKTIEETAIIINYSKRHTERLHAKALSIIKI